MSGLVVTPPLGSLILTLQLLPALYSTEYVVAFAWAVEVAFLGAAPEDFFLTQKYAEMARKTMAIAQPTVINAPNIGVICK